jgi:hypothetical protein
MSARKKPSRKPSSAGKKATKRPAKTSTRKVASKAKKKPAEKAKKRAARPAAAETSRPTGGDRELHYSDLRRVALAQALKRLQ